MKAPKRKRRAKKTLSKESEQDINAAQLLTITGMLGQSTLAIAVGVVTLLRQLPSDRARKRVLTFIEDTFDEGRDLKQLTRE